MPANASRNSGERPRRAAASAGRGRPTATGGWPRRRPPPSPTCSRTRVTTANAPIVREAVGEQVEQHARDARPGPSPRTPVRMNPACAIEEYASIRFMSVCTIATTEPSTIVRMATTPRSPAASPSATAGSADVGDPQQRAERGDLRARGHEAGDRGRRALVDVRRPGVERRGADLEQQADGEQRDADAAGRPVRRRRAAPCRSRAGDVGQPHRAGEAVEQRDAEQEERRGERAEQEVLQRRLLREQPTAPGQPAQQVQRQREHLERDEHRQQVAGGGEDQHAADREQQQRVDLGLHQPGPAARASSSSRAGDGRGLRRRTRRAGRRPRSAIDQHARAAPAARIVPCRNSAGPSITHGAAEADGAAGVLDAGHSARRRPARRRAPSDAEDELRRAPRAARRERLDQHADHRGAEHDGTGETARSRPSAREPGGRRPARESGQHRGERAIAITGSVPSSTAAVGAAGSVTPPAPCVRSTAGLMTSSDRLRVEAERHDHARSAAR